MSALRIIGYIAAAILIFFGVMFIWATFNPEGQIGYLLTGTISVLFGFGLIWLASRKPAGAAGEQNVTLKMDLPGETKISQMKCQSCGGSLSAENVKMIAGAPVVECPFCGSTYQLTEEPKW
jgi:Na+/melibiose symporter-like transporter